MLTRTRMRHRLGRGLVDLTGALAGVALTLSCGTKAGEVVEAPTQAQAGSMAELLEIRSIPRFKPWTTHQAAGYDPDGGFYDSGNFLRTEEGRRHVLMEATGPGCIDRMWFTYKSRVGREPYDLLIYLDDPVEPVLRMDLDTLFSNARAPFLEPLAGRCGNPDHPARYSYVPLGYASFARVVLQPTASPDRYQYRRNSRGESIPHIYYQITHRQFPPGTPVRRFSWRLDEAEQEALRRVRRSWGRLGTSPWEFSRPVQPRTLDVHVQPGQTNLLAGFDEPGMICGLRLRADHPEALRLMFFWDGAAVPAVSVPFGPFFGCPDGSPPKTDVKGFWFGQQGGMFYHYLPMPFHVSARLCVVGKAGAGAHVSGELTLLREPPGAEEGLLHARRYDYAPPGRGQDYVVLDVHGRGHFAGLIMDRPGHMEGDDRLFVDDQPAPAWHGTGTEDYFNFAWGLSHTGSWPLHGITQHAGGPVCYRVHLPAGAPFRRSLRITWEHGHDPALGPNLDQGHYSGVALYYLR